MDYKNLSQEKTEVIQNVDSYNNEMQKSLIDKIFFLDKIEDASVFIDYGCANGAVLKLANSIMPKNTYAGYDTSDDMIQVARKEADTNLIFTNDMNIIQNIVKESKSQKRKTCISLMSLIHEVYAYGPDKVKEFWNIVFNKEMFDYIAIRDMCVSKTTSRPSDPLSVAKIRMSYDKNRIAQWESNWGSLNENWSFTHFLLTYRYIYSWDRELYENYLPLCLEDLMALIPKGWEPTYLEHYTLPFIRQQVKTDFDIDLQDRTHVKLVLKNKKP